MISAELPARAAFFTREDSNAEDAARRLGVNAPIRLRQVHSARCLTFAEPPTTALPEADAPEADAPEADAMVLAPHPDLACAIITADCLPVLFADAKTGVVAAAHAGWRGLLAGVLESTLAAMARLGANPADVVAALGPCIQQRNYEVGEDFRDAFLAQDSAAQAFFCQPDKAPRPFFDLPGYAQARMERAGVRCHSLGLCTFADPTRFYSYRRGDRAARQLALIAPRLPLL